MGQKVSIVLMSLLVAAPALGVAQISASPKSVPPSFQAGARLALVPVVVRDRDGRAVTDLAQSSFQVFDNGKPQSITSFSVEHGVAATQAPAAPERFVAYFFDDVSPSDISALVPMREAALQSLRNMQGGERVAILSSSCRIVQDFTDDRAKLGQAISKLQPDAMPACQVAPTLPLQIVLLRTVVRRMQTLPGTKSIVIVSSGFRVQNTRQEMRDQLIDEAIQAKVTFHALHFASSGRSSSNIQDLIGTADAPAMRAEQPIDPANLYLIARGTGGDVIEATNSWQVAFREVSTPECYYVLGFVPQGKPDGKYHKLKVKLNDARKLKVRAREGYYAAPRPSAPVAVASTPRAVSPAPKAAVVEDTTGPPKAARAVTPASAVVAAAPIQVKGEKEAAERSTTREPLMFSTRTSLVLVPVVVKDKSGRAVGNLQKHNFQIWDDGKRQEITNFNEEKSERAESPNPIAPPVTRDPAAKAATPVIPDSFVAFVFDNVHIRIEDLERVRQAVWQNVTETLDASARIAVVTTSRRGAMLDFTKDRDKIRTALNRVQPTPVYRSLCGICGDLSFVHAYKVVRGDRQAVQLAVPIVTKGGATPSTAGLAQRLNPASYTPLEMRTETKAQAAVNAGEHETELSLHTLRELARRMAALAGRRTIVLVGHGFFVTADLQSDLEDTIDRAIRSGVVIHTLNSSGLLTGWEMGQSAYDDDTVGPDGTSPYKDEARLAGGMTLRTLAEGTGGTAIENSNDYLSSIRRLTSPPEYRYVLGFSPQNLLPNGDFHPLTIKLANVQQEGLTIQARRGYYAPKRADGLTEASAKEIETAIFARNELRDLPVGIRTETSHPEGRVAELTVLADIDLKFLHLRQVNGRNCDDVTLVAAVFDRNGNFIAGKQHLLKLRLRDETVASLEQQPPETLKTTFGLGPGAYLVRLVVRSAEEQTMAAVSRTVEIQ